MINTLREYISFLEKGDFILKVREKVRREDLPELIERLSFCGKVLIFEEIDGYNCKVVANLLPSSKFFSFLFPEGFDFFLEAIKKKEREGFPRKKGITIKSI